MADATTILDALRGVNAYPIPLRTIVGAAERRGLTVTDEAAADTLSSASYRLAEADLLLWLSLAPDISQGGQSYSFTDEQRKRLRLRAEAVYDELEEGDSSKAAVYGYKGDRL
ncbi:MAG: hypothetical protein LUC24_05360 [Bacteroidales bacterium]|nr:hypothetical protein [Bacteroidales bacterium]